MQHQGTKALVKRGGRPRTVLHPGPEHQSRNTWIRTRPRSWLALQGRVESRRDSAALDACVPTGTLCAKCSRRQDQNVRRGARGASEDLEPHCRLGSGRFSATGHHREGGCAPGAGRSGRHFPAWASSEAAEGGDASNPSNPSTVSWHATSSPSKVGWTDSCHDPTPRPQTRQKPRGSSWARLHQVPALTECCLGTRNESAPLAAERHLGRGLPPRPHAAPLVGLALRAPSASAEALGHLPMISEPLRAALRACRARMGTPSAARRPDRSHRSGRGGHQTYRPVHSEGAFHDSWEEHSRMARLAQATQQELSEIAGHKHSAGSGDPGGPPTGAAGCRGGAGPAARGRVGSVHADPHRGALFRTTH